MVEGYFCDFCDQFAVVEVNGNKGCLEHIDHAMGIAFAPIKEALNQTGDDMPDRRTQLARELNYRKAEQVPDRVIALIAKWIVEEKAAAWDEGYAARRAECRRGHAGDNDINPYRSEEGGKDGKR